MRLQFVFIVHSVAEKLNYSKCKHDVSRAVGIPFSGDSGHQGTESPLQEIWWGFRPVGIPSSGDSVQWGFRVHTYGITSWGGVPESKLRPHFKIQKRCIRILFGNKEKYLNKFKTCCRVRPVEEKIHGREHYEKKHTTILCLSISYMCTTVAWTHSKHLSIEFQYLYILYTYYQIEKKPFLLPHYPTHNLSLPIF